MRERGRQRCVSWGSWKPRAGGLPRAVGVGSESHPRGRGQGQKSGPTAARVAWVPRAHPQKVLRVCGLSRTTGAPAEGPRGRRHCQPCRGRPSIPGGPGLTRRRDSCSRSRARSLPRSGGGPLPGIPAAPLPPILPPTPPSVHLHLPPAHLPPELHPPSGWAHPSPPRHPS